MQRPIFILGAHKSGTSLLRALFDGHPDVFAVPIEAHFFEQVAWWIDYAYRRTFPQKLNRAGFMARANAWIAHCNASEDPQADSIAKDRFDLDAFAAALDGHLPHLPPNDDPARTFHAYVTALHQALHGKPLPEGVRILEKSVENAEYALDLQAMFPEAVFIHILRNPYANLVSIRKYKSAGRYPWMGPAIRSLYNAFYYLYRNARRVSNYRVITYEALVQEPTSTMQLLCAQAGLAFNDALLTPTFLGEPWGGNSTANQPFTGISTARINAWKDDIIPLEVALINKYLRHAVLDYGYEPMEPQGSVYRPARKEPLKHYLANRLVYRATQY